MSQSRIALPYMQSIYTELLNAGFGLSSVFPGERILTPNTPYICTEKQQGNSVCVVFLHNCSGKDDLVFKQELLNIYSGLRLYNSYFKNVFAVHLILHDNANYLQFLDKCEVYENQPVYNIYWPVNLGAFVPKIDYNPKAPTDLFGLRAIIRKSLKNTAETRNTETDLSKIKPRDNAPKPKHKTAYLTFVFLGVNLVIYLWAFFGKTENIISKFSNLPLGYLKSSEIYRLFTSIFIHGSIDHIVSNAFGTVIFGIRTEKYYGRLQFLLIYLLSGIASSGFSVVFTRMPSIGSSGAVFGLFGAVLSRVYVTKHHVDGVSLSFMLVYTAINLLSGLFNPQIDNFGHIGGMLTGLILGYIFTRSDMKKSGITE